MVELGRVSLSRRAPCDGLVAQFRAPGSLLPVQADALTLSLNGGSSGDEMPCWEPRAHIRAVVVGHCVISGEDASLARARVARINVSSFWHAMYRYVTCNRMLHQACRFCRLKDPESEVFDDAPVSTSQAGTMPETYGEPDGGTVTEAFRQLTMNATGRRYDQFAILRLRVILLVYGKSGAVFVKSKQGHRKLRPSRRARCSPGEAWRPCRALLLRGRQHVADQVEAVRGTNGARGC